MRDFLYDLRRTLTGKFTIIAIVIIILLSIGVGLIFTSSGSSTSVPQTQVFPNYYYDNSTGTYNVSVLAVNQYGQPISSLPIYTYHNDTYVNETTNSYGYLNYSFKSNATFEYFGSSYVPVKYSGFGTPVYSNLTAHNENYGFFDITQVLKPGTTNQYQLFLFYHTGNGSLPPTTYVYYSIYNITGNPGTATTTNMTEFATISGSPYTTLFINPPSRTAVQALEVALFNSTSASAKPIQLTTYTPLNAIDTIGLTLVAFSAYGEIFGLVIPILASLSAYYYFGKDKASGVLESVITRPVTKGRIILSRYIGNVGSLFIGMVVGSLLFEIFLYRATGSYLPANYLGLLVWVYLVQIAAFTGLIYLVSQFVRSQGGILGIAIAIFLAYGFFWTLVVEPLILRYGFHAQAGTTTYTLYSVILDAISPAGYSSLTIFLLDSLSSITRSFNAASFGVTNLSVAIIGVVWVVVPILVAYIIGRKRD